MSSINNIEVKNEKMFPTRNGDMFTGEIYINGKKVADWTQDQEGIEDFYNFSDDTAESYLDEVAEKYAATLPDDFVLKSIFNKDILLAEIIQFNEFEKTYKKYLRFGYIIMVFATDGLNSANIRGFMSEDEFNKGFENAKNEMIKSLNSEYPINFYVFKDISDFKMKV